MPTHLDDQVRLALIGKSNLLKIPTDRGFGISLWGTSGSHYRLSTHEKLVWLDYGEYSWTEHCFNELYHVSDNAANCQGLFFHIVLPLPPKRRLTASKVHLIAQDKEAQRNGFIVVLADVWLTAYATRMIMQFREGEFLISVVRRFFPHLPEPTHALLEWSYGDEYVLLSEEEEVFLPNGAFVHLTFESECTENTETSLLQIYAIQPKNTSTLSFDTSRCYYHNTRALHREAEERQAQARREARQWTWLDGEEDILFALQWQFGYNPNAFPIQMYGLDAGDVGQRTTTVQIGAQFDVFDFCRRIREAWEDMLFHGQVIAIHMLFPQPDQERNGLHFIVDLNPGLGDTPCVVQLDTWLPTGRQRETSAIRLARPLTIDQMLHFLGFPFSWTDLGYSITLRHRNILVPMEQPFDIEPGFFLCIQAVLNDMPAWQTEHDMEDEEALFMQVVRSKPTTRSWLNLLRNAAPNKIFLYVHLWLLSPGLGIWSTTEATKVILQESNDWFVDWSSALGADLNQEEFAFLLIEPKPPMRPFTLVPDAFALIVQEPPRHIAFLFDVTSNRHSRRVAAFFEPYRGHLSTRRIFDDYMLEHNCGAESWCFLRYEGTIHDWPGPFMTTQCRYFEIVEIALEGDTVSTCTPTSAIDTADSDDEETSLVQFAAAKVSAIPCDMSKSHMLTNSTYMTTLSDHGHFCGTVPDTGDVAVCQSANFVSLQRLSLLSGLHVVDWIHDLIFSRLRPPGNTVILVDENTLQWTTTMNSLDDITPIGEHILISDLAPPQRVISLTEELDDPQPQQPRDLIDTSLTLRLPDFEEVYNHIMSLFQCHWNEPEDSLDDLPLPTLAILNEMDIGNLHEMDYIEIYTDGSFSPQQDLAGWAFAVFGVKNDTYYRVHTACGPVKLQQDNFGFTGTQKTGSRTAEVEALIMALIWRISSAMIFECSFLFDATTAGFPIAGSWNFKPENKHIRVARALAQLAETIHPGKNRFAHVKAHRGCHGNELVDTLAKYARALEYPIGFGVVDFGWAIDGEPMPLEWIWMNYFGTFGDNPPPLCGNSIVHTGPFTMPEVSKAWPQCVPFVNAQNVSEKSEEKHTKTRWVDLGFLTFNVQSLGHDVGFPSVGAHAYVRKQLQAHGLHIACFQETRAKSSGIISSDSHHRVIVQANKGQGGVEVWLLRSLEGQKKLFCELDDLIVLFENPEILILKAIYMGRRLLVISAHAPHSSKPVEEIRGWWSLLEQQLHQHTSPDLSTILGIDANAHFSTDMEGIIGDCGLEELTNENARLFGALLAKFSLFVPSTFSWHHVGETSTWRRFSGIKPSRCDYLAMPQIWSTAQIHSETLLTLDALGTFKDHIPLAAWVKIQSTKTSPKKRGFFVQPSRKTSLH